MKQTTHCKLNQWEPSDRVLREDFNKDNRTIDAELHKQLKLHIGSYTGNNSFPREITLGFRPKIVVSTDDNGTFSSSAGIFGGITMDGENYENPTMVTSDTGFILKNQYCKTNLAGRVYHYFALY